MANLACPHCQISLEVPAELSGQTIACPSCQGRIYLPQLEPDLTDEEINSSKQFVLLVCWFTGHAMLFFLLLAVSGLPGAAFGLGTVLVGQAVIWKRAELWGLLGRARRSESLQRFVQQVHESSQAFQQDGKPRESNSLSGESQWEAEPGNASEDDDRLVEIRSPKGREAGRRQTAFTGGRDAPQGRRTHRGGSALTLNVPKGRVQFLSEGNTLDLGRGKLESPLVYASQSPLNGRFDASLIDGSLPVGDSGCAPRSELPYWPSYYECSSAQRARYLDWLLGGRCDPKVELGYVFIYFYGLERRVVVDRCDFAPVAREVLRLLRIYSYSNSFRRYATSLLWLTLALESESGRVDSELFEAAVNATERWHDDLVALCLAVLCHSGRPLPANVALAVCQNDPRSTSSVVVKRHKEEFHRLFANKYKAEHGEGIVLRTSKRDNCFNYHPASGTLLHAAHEAGGKQTVRLPNPLGLPSQFKGLVTLWEATVDELKAYSRAARSADGQMTAEVYEALPEELRVGDHPEFDDWMRVWEEHVDDNGWPIVPASSLAALKQLPARGTLTKTQCHKLLTTADAVGLGVEPDARITGKNYKWDERLALFFVEDDTPCNAKSYLAASVLLRMGATVAAADGRIDKEELEFIAEHLEGQFDLSDADSKRLERLEYLLLRSQTGDIAVTKTLTKRLTQKQRLLVGEFLVGVAAADEVVTSDEVKALRKAYRSLDLEESDLDDLLARHASAKVGAAPDASNRSGGELRLDMSAVSRIMTETRQVAEVLRQAMSEGDDETEEGPTEAPAASTAIASPPESMTPQTAAAAPGSLAPRYQPFLAELLTRPEWTGEELRQLADQFGLMLAGAIEAVNEWSLEEHGDWLVEEGPTYAVRQELLTEEG